MERNQAGRGWRSKALVYSLASSLAGLATGVFLGAAGSLLALEFRVALASLLAVLAIVLGSIELSGRHVRLVQCDRETPQHWLNAGPLRWVLRNDMALGFGATSRIGFWLWYVIPLGALLFARPELGGIIYGTYSTVRGMAVWVIILGLSHWVDGNSQDWLLAHTSVARVVAAGQLILLGVAVVVAIGL